MRHRLARTTGGVYMPEKHRTKHAGQCSAWCLAPSKLVPGAFCHRTEHDDDKHVFSLGMPWERR